MRARVTARAERGPESSTLADWCAQTKVCAMRVQGKDFRRPSATRGANNNSEVSSME